MTSELRDLDNLNTSVTNLCYEAQLTGDYQDAVRYKHSLIFVVYIHLFSFNVLDYCPLYFYPSCGVDTLPNHGT